MFCFELHLSAPTDHTPQNWTAVLRRRIQHKAKKGIPAAGRGFIVFGCSINASLMDEASYLLQSEKKLPECPSGGLPSMLEAATLN